MATDGPDSIKPVVVPATMLESSLVKDRSLCPVRALRVYLDKTKSMRKGKTFLFVYLREGYSKDITDQQQVYQVRLMMLELWLHHLLLREVSPWSGS